MSELTLFTSMQKDLTEFLATGFFGFAAFSVSLKNKNIAAFRKQFLNLEKCQEIEVLKQNNF